MSKGNVWICKWPSKSIKTSSLLIYSSKQHAHKHNYTNEARYVYGL